MNKHIVGIVLGGIALPVFLGSALPALADNSNTTTVKIDTLQTVNSTPIVDSNIDYVMRRKGPGPGGIPPSVDLQTGSPTTIIKTDGTDRGRPGRGGGPRGVDEIQVIQNMKVPSGQ